MNRLDLRDRRRATKVWDFVTLGRPAEMRSPNATGRKEGIEAIAAALKREREETGLQRLDISSAQRRPSEGQEKQLT